MTEVETSFAGPTHSRFSILKYVTSPILVFALIILFVEMGDAMMSYLTPILIQDKVNDPGMMGIIMASSSVVGIICDMVFGEWFRGRKFTFFIISTIAIAILFPLTYLLLPPIVPFFLLAMFLWGVYYELFVFAQSTFIESHTSKSEHSLTWGIISMFKSISLTVAPLLVGSLLEQGPHVPLIATVGFHLIAFVILFVFLQSRTHRHHAHRAVKIETHERPHHSLHHEFRIWRTIGKRIWPLLIFSFMLVVVDATFWSVGALLADKLSNANQPGELILTLYSLPTLFMGILAGRFARPLGKKRAAFISGLLSGIALMLAGMSQELWVMLLFMFLVGVCNAITWPELLGVYSDYVSRLETRSNDLIGLQSSIGSLGYIIGPIVAGTVAGYIGNQETFTLMGALLAVVSAVMLWKVPRKIKMPQAELEIII